MNITFEFKTEFWTPTYTQISANTIDDFKNAIKLIPLNSLLYHFYINIFNYNLISSIYTNDISYWFYKNGYYSIAEEIASIDPTEYLDLENLRQDLINILSKYSDHKIIQNSFYFLTIKRNIFFTNLKANTLEEFVNGIRNSSINSIFYHLIMSKLDNKKPINDYSEWLSIQGYSQKAELINKIDIYALNLVQVKQLILEALTK
jgi:hypothetical protein